MEASEVVAMYESGISISDIAKEFAVSQQTVRRVLKEQGKEIIRKVQQVDEAAIANAYTEGQPVPLILSKFHVNYNRLYQILHAHGVELRKVTGKEADVIRMNRAVELYEAGAPLWAIKEDTGVAQPALHAELHKRGVALRRPRII